MIRKYILKYFEKLLDLTCIVSIIGLLIASFSVAMIPVGWGSNSFSFGKFLTTFFSGSFAIIAVFGVLYLLFDIRDELKKSNSRTDI